MQPSTHHVANAPLPRVTSHESPVTSYSHESPVTSHEPPVTSHEPPVTSHVPNHQVSILVSWKLPVKSKFRAASHGTQRNSRAASRESWRLPVQRRWWKCSLRRQGRVAPQPRALLLS